MVTTDTERRGMQSPTATHQTVALHIGAKTPLFTVVCAKLTRYAK